VFLRLGTGVVAGGVAVLVAVAEGRMLGCTATLEVMGALAFGIGGAAIKPGGPERFRAVGGATIDGLRFAAGLRAPYLDWSFVSSLV
jgi:hypothetical protein